MSVITIDGLSKSFGSVRAVDGLTFSAQPGTVTGFLGPNGAGKTTTLRMLLGLVTPTSGRALIDGRPYAELERPAELVGAALEATGFHPGRSARNHLRVICAAAGLPVQRVDAALELTGLTEAADRGVGGFSLGMRQRLALAAAVLGEPEVLILDEPANGLDPAGIAWLRSLLRNLADGGCTVLVSSHVLSEVEQTVDHVVIVARGRLVRDVALAELMHDHGGLRVRTAQAAELTAELERAGASVRTDDGRLLVTGVSAERIGQAALDARAVLTELTEERSGLEEIFLQLTRDEMLGAEPAGTVAGS
ncbi:ABC transporter ATP-binding protein [Actinomadura craniellae]|uniref:ABC transporter ATP-binding protein n=1 Tax=Actinomadura craniellae TaxID=2231787 RepID=A0A365HDH4_9ACTN|nr:ATP-binding cassette domain-containing protein [Actinomadura craniellae]RAY17180.1 ABC transporter ATP-binding protein [Actinomadura craniellae]